VCVAVAQAGGVMAALNGLANSTCDDVTSSCGENAITSGLGGSFTHLPQSAAAAEDDGVELYRATPGVVALTPVGRCEVDVGRASWR